MPMRRALARTGDPLPIAVRAGMTFRVPRRGRPARHVRVVRVLTGSGTPCAVIEELTRNGTRKRGGVVARSVLTVRDGAWRMRARYEEAL